MKHRVFPMVRSILLSSLAGAALIRVVASCAEGEPPAVHAADAAPEAVPDAAVLPEEPVPDAGPSSACEAGEWCEVTLPVTTQVSINGVWGAGPNDVWIVGSPDLILHWNGTQLSRSSAYQPDTTSATRQTLFGVWGSSATDVWTFNAGNAIWHTGGTDAWTVSRTDKDAGPPWTGLITAMWGGSANDIWAVGPFSFNTLAPTVWHSDGWRDGVPHWVAAPADNDITDLRKKVSFNGVWGSSSEVWVVGQNGKTRRTEGWKDGGAAWTPINSGTSLDLQAVWGGTNGDVWVGGAGGVVRRLSPQPDGSYLVTPFDLPTQVTVFALTGFGPSDVWAAGAEGTLAHWDGKVWSMVEVPAMGNKPNDLLAIWGASADDIWVTGQNLLLHKGSAVLPGTTVRKP